ncbi:MAG: ABC transporter substrate-binding protein [Pseudacidovorax sp.]|nr:ABC transporter substrate-binding protein [Pseudacidovorax sp.]
MKPISATLRRTCAAAAVALLVIASAPAQAQLKVGVLATLEGALAAPGQDGVRGVELAVDQAKAQAGGKRITLIVEGTNAQADVVVAKARKLVEQDKVDIIVGPLSGSEGIAIKNYAKSVPSVTFINGSSAAENTTLRDPAPNFFRFMGDGTQWMAGLGNYAYDVRGYRKVAVVAEDYSFPYAQVNGFMQEYCAKGGKVPAKLWVPLGTKDYSSVISRVPPDIDALFVVLGGADAVTFMSQYNQAGGKAPLLAGSITVDQSVLAAKGPFRRQIVGALTAGPVADNNDAPEWKAFVEAYRAKFPKGLPSPSLFANNYYTATQAMLMALDQVKGDLSNNQAEFRKALAGLTVKSPSGEVKLDESRQGIVDVYLTEVAQNADGQLYNKLVKITKGVNQTLGQPRTAYLAKGEAGRDSPACP